MTPVPAPGGTRGEQHDDRALAYGADWNPEQWPDAVNLADIDLMREAGVNRVSLGIFAWSAVEPEDGRFELDETERLMDRLAAAGIGVNLATPTASPPWWLLARHPEIQLTDRQGRQVPGGGRLSWCPSSPAFRAHAVRITTALAERLGTHPALRLWHLGNELGNENRQCFCDRCAAAFRTWLARRYPTVGDLNEAWGTAFWGHTYRDWSQVTPPRATGNPPDPGLELDYRRFCSDALLEHYRAEADAVRAAGSGAVVTTNLMIAQGNDHVDNAAWADHVDVVANDHYTVAADPERHVELAFSADRTRGVARGRQWLLMEHSTSAVNWQPRNRAKAAGELRRDTLSHVARGADGAMFFQWRASTAGAEQFHSAMVPHAGTGTRVFREVCALGADLSRLGPVVGTLVELAEVAILWDAQAHWAMDAARPPSVDIDYPDEPQRFYRALFRRGIRADVLPADAPLTGYRLVIVPTLYHVPDGLADRLADVAAGGGHVVVTALSGVVDHNGRVIGGGYPGALRDVLGVRGEELLPLQQGERVRVSGKRVAGRWIEHVNLTSALPTAIFEDGPLAGYPAISSRSIGRGTISYLACLLGRGSLGRLVGDLIAELDLAPPAPVDGTADLVWRCDSRTGERYLFCINHTGRDARVTVTGEDLLTGTAVDRVLTLRAGGVAVVRERSAPEGPAADPEAITTIDRDESRT